MLHALQLVVSVDTYNSEDWKKLKAAVNVLKNPVLDDSVLLEASAIGQYLHSDFVCSQSTQSIPNLTEEDLEARPFHDYQELGEQGGGSHNQARRFSEGRIYAYRVQLSDSNKSHENNPYASNLGDSMINNWVAGLPEYGRRSRSHTDPMSPPTVTEREGSSFKAKTLPKSVSLVQSHRERGSVEAENNYSLSAKIKASDTLIKVPDTYSPLHVAPVRHASASKRTSVRSSMSSPSAGSDTRGSSSLQSPSTPATPNSKLVKIYMSRVQKG